MYAELELLGGGMKGISPAIPIVVSGTIAALLLLSPSKGDMY